MAKLTILGIEREGFCIGYGCMQITSEEINGTTYLAYVRPCELTPDQGCFCGNEDAEAWADWGTAEEE